MQTQRELPDDILCVEADDQANYVIVGDIHGNINNLEKFLGSLRPDDRPVFVGDLVDKGRESVAVLKKLMDFQAHHPGKLYIVKGNHETLCLQAIEELEKIAQFIIPLKDKSFNILDKINTEINKKDINTKTPAELIRYHFSQFTPPIINHLLNGGTWLVKLFNEELKNGNIKLETDGSAKYTEESQVQKIKKFMANLPYVIHVEGDRPFNAVHADMPFNDEELLKKIHNNDLHLSEIEKDYATWAREVKSDEKKDAHSIKDTGRNKNSIPTYVGHSIIASGAPVIREKTNTINLDVGSFLSQSILVVNHTVLNCKLMGEIQVPESKKKWKENIKNATNELNDHFKDIKLTLNLRAQPSTNDTDDDMELKQSYLDAMTPNQSGLALYDLANDVIELKKSYLAYSTAKNQTGHQADINKILEKTMQICKDGAMKDDVKYSGIITLLTKAFKGEVNNYKKWPLRNEAGFFKTINDAAANTYQYPKLLKGILAKHENLPRQKPTPNDSNTNKKLSK